MAANEPPQSFTIIQADGLYPDTAFEEQLFAPQDGQNYKLNYLQLSLWPTGQAHPKPWSSIPQEIREQVNGIMTLKMYFREKDIPLFPNLKVIVRMGVGYDTLSLPALLSHNILCANVPDYGTNEIADHAFALILSLRRGILLHHFHQATSPPSLPYAQISDPLISRLQTQSLGIIGLGRIGTAVALRAKAFGFKEVVFFDPYLPNGVDKALLLTRVKRIEEVFERCGVVSLHCPATRETRNKFIGKELISKMGRGSVLVNTARGEILDLDAVEWGLREGILAGAGLDVLEREPPSEKEEEVHSLVRAYRKQEEWVRGRLVLTCHSAFYSPESYVDVRVKSAETMRDVLIDGGRSNLLTLEME